MIELSEPVVDGTIVRLDNGKYSNDMVGESAKVYGWGSSKEGQLGTHQRKIYYQPKELNVYPSSDIFAGVKCSFFNTSKGIFAVGLNNEGQLGLGH